MQLLRHGSTSLENVGTLPAPHAMELPGGSAYGLMAKPVATSFECYHQIVLICLNHCIAALISQRLPVIYSDNLSQGLHKPNIVPEAEEEEVVHRFTLVRHRFEDLICQHTPQHSIDWR